MTAVSRRSFLLAGGTTAAAGAVLTGAGAARAASPGGIHVAAGQTCTVTVTTRVSAVTIERGGVLTAPAGHSLTMTVDGGKGARLNPGDGILVQVIDNDDPGPVTVRGVLRNAGVYAQPTGEPVRDAKFDVSVAHATDSVLSFTGIELAGNFYNGMRGNLNLVLRFTASKVAGVITATLAEHHVDEITSANWQELGAVTNTPRPAVNNGVIVSLAEGSSWTVAGASYLTALSLDARSAVIGPHGGKVTMTVDGRQTAITPGASYAGAIVVAPAVVTPA